MSLADVLAVVVGSTSSSLFAVSLLKAHGWLALSGAVLSGLPVIGLFVGLVFNAVGAFTAAEEHSWWTHRGGEWPERDEPDAVSADEPWYRPLGFVVPFLIVAGWVLIALDEA